MEERFTRQLSKIESSMEDELERHNKPRINRLNRLRHAGEKLLHSKGVLMTVVVLNCLDCVLVLSELILDVNFIKGMVVTAEVTMEKFNFLLKEKYPEIFGDVPVYDTHAFYNGVLMARLSWIRNATIVNGSDVEPCHPGYSSGRERRALASQAVGLFDEGSGVFQNNDDPAFLHENVYSLDEVISHSFHKASITILGFLLLYTLCKLFCTGRHFLDSKLECFDGVVVVTSFVLDIGYIRGLTNYPVESFVVILAVMIPWRVIRVLNSLVIAVLDNHHFRTKLLYKKNKTLDRSLKASQQREEAKQQVCPPDLTKQEVAGMKVSVRKRIECLKEAFSGNQSKHQLPLIGGCFGLHQSDSFHYGQGETTETSAMLDLSAVGSTTDCV